MLPALNAAATPESSPNWLAFLLLVAVVVVVFLIIRRARPSLRERRHRAWEEAGLLPQQLDPASRRHSDTTDVPKPGDEPPRGARS